MGQSTLPNGAIDDRNVSGTEGPRVHKGKEGCRKFEAGAALILETDLDSAGFARLQRFRQLEGGCESAGEGNRGAKRGTDVGSRVPRRDL